MKYYNPTISRVFLRALRSNSYYVSFTSGEIGPEWCPRSHSQRFAQLDKLNHFKLANFTQPRFAEKEYNIGKQNGVWSTMFGLLYK